MDIPSKTKMIVFIDGDAEVLKVTNEKGEPALEGLPFEGKKPVFWKTLRGHAVFAYDTNPQRCVTYQTPYGPRTV